MFLEIICCQYIFYRRTTEFSCRDFFDKIYSTMIDGNTIKIHFALYNHDCTKFFVSDKKRILIINVILSERLLDATF